MPLNGVLNDTVAILKRDNSHGSNSCYHVTVARNKQVMIQSFPLCYIKSNLSVKSNTNTFFSSTDGIAIRGCYVDADERMKVICSDRNNNQCLLCHGKDCNTGNSSGAGSITVSLSLLSLMIASFWYLN